MTPERQSSLEPAGEESSDLTLPICDPHQHLWDFVGIYEWPRAWAQSIATSSEYAERSVAKLHVYFSLWV